MTRTAACIRLAAAAALLAACGNEAPGNGIAADGEDRDPGRLAQTVRPAFQQLDLRIDPDDAGYSGSTSITIDIAEPTRELRLHAEDIDIRSLRLSATSGEIPATFMAGDYNMLVVSPGGELAPGRYRLDIDFDNNFNTDGVGIYRSEVDGVNYVFSQFEAIDAREAFPCFDEPGFKYPWQVTISVPDDLLAVTNTPAENVTSVGGWTTTEFAATPALPSYLIAVIVGAFDTVPVAGLSIPARVVVPKGKSAMAAYAAETAGPLMSYLEDYFGEPYPFAKLDLIAVSGGFAGAMEHPGAITYSDFILLIDDTASEAQKQQVARVNAHEFAHQWFGNLVTMRWWDDLWLNESFADWMANKAVAAVYPEFNSGDDELGIVFRIMDTDASPTTPAIRREFAALDNFEENILVAYYKGKTVLGMFEAAAGEDRFRDGIVRYIRQFSRGNAEANDLWNALSESAEFDLAGALRSFIDQPGIPLVSITDEGEGRYRFSQARLLTGGETAETSPSWIIPVSYQYRDDTGIHTGELILDETSERVDLGDDVVWLLPNAGQLGYYRWNIPPDMLVRLGSEASEVLDGRDRMGILSNLWALLTADEAEPGDYLDTLAGMAGGEEPAIINAVLDRLNNVRQTFVTADLRDEFAAYVRRALGPLLDRIGTTARTGESPELADLRPQLLLWLSDYGNEERSQRVTAGMVSDYLAGKAAYSPAVGVAMRAEARRGDQALFDTFVGRLDSAGSIAERRAFLSAIGSFREPALVGQAMELLKRDSFRRDDLEIVLARLAAWTDNESLLLDWIIGNDEAIRQRLPDDTLVRVPALLSSCSTRDLARIREVFGTPEWAVPGMDSALSQAEGLATECAMLRQRELPAVARYLSGAPE